MPKRRLQPSHYGTGDGYLGQRIRELRLARDMSQQDLARAVGTVLGSALSQEAISHYETGLKMPPPRTMGALAQALKTTVDGTFLVGSSSALRVNRQAVAQRIHTLIGLGTQRAFAARIGVPPQYVNRYLNGVMPDTEVVLRIARAYGVTMEWLLTGMVSSERAHASRTPPSTPSTRDLHAVVRTARDADRLIRQLLRDLHRVGRFIERSPRTVPARHSLRRS